MGQILLHHSREAQTKGEHLDENLTRSLGRALFGQPERYISMTAEEIAADGVSYVANRSNNNGQTALMTACEVGSADAVIALLNIGADPWRGDGVVGRTCIHFAAGRGHGEVIRTIVGFVQSQTAEQLISRYRVEHIPKCYLLQGNVHDIPTAPGLTPLAYASWHGQRQCIEILCELGSSLYTTSWMRGLDPECRECLDGSTPLHLAALRGSLRTVKCLLRCYVKQVEERDRLLQDPQRPPLSPLSSHPFVRAQQVQQREMPDIRLILDSHGFNPHAIASLRGHHPSILRALDVNTPLATVLAEDEAQERALGPPRLTEIVSKFYQGILQARIEEIRKSPAEPDGKNVTSVLEESIRGGMAFLHLISRTSSKKHVSPHKVSSNQAVSTSGMVGMVGMDGMASSTTTTFMNLSQGPVGVKGCSDDEGESPKEKGEGGGGLADALGPLPTLLAHRPPVAPTHRRNHSSAHSRVPSGGGGAGVGFGAIQENTATASPFHLAAESSWTLHPFGGGGGVRVSQSNNSPLASPFRGGAVGSITLEGLLNSPSLDITENPIFRQTTQDLLPPQGVIGSERGSTMTVTVHGGSNYYNPPPSLHQAAAAAVADNLVADRSTDPNEQQELRAAAQMAASSHPEAVSAAAARLRRMTDDRSHRGSALGDVQACCVCLDDDSGAECIFLNILSCNHTICMDCAQELLRHAEYKPALCPLCRGYMKTFERAKSRKPRVN